MKRISALTTAFALALTSMASGLATDAFRQIADGIIANNPALAARKASSDSEILQMQAENNLSDPEVEFEHQWGQDQIGNKWSISISQSFDWPGLYHRRSLAAKAGKRAFTQLYQAEEIELRQRVTETLIDYVTAIHKLKLSEEVKVNLDSIYDYISRVYENGGATIIDYRKICLERSEAITRFEDARLAVDNLRYELIALNGGEYVDLSQVTDYPAMSLNDEDYYAAKIKDCDPRLAAAASNVETARLTASAERLRSLPGFSLGYIHNVEIGEHFNGITAGITLPFFSNRKKVAAANADFLSAQYSLDEYTFEAQRRLHADYAAVKNYQRRMKAYDNMFSDNDNYLELLHKSLMGGQLPFTIYLYEINYYIEAKTSYIDLVHNYTLSLASLNRFE